MQCAVRLATAVLSAAQCGSGSMNLRGAAWSIVAPLFSKERSHHAIETCARHRLCAGSRDAASAGRVLPSRTVHLVAIFSGPGAGPPEARASGGVLSAAGG